MLTGLGVGVKLATVDTYLSELVPKHLRDKTFAVQQAVSFIAVPAVTFLAWMCIPSEFLGLTGWRWVVLFDSLGAIVVWFARFGLPESPRWLSQQGRLEGAESVMRSI